jgi:hypothetical protein
VGLEGFYEIELEQDLPRAALDDLDAALADILVAIPGIGGAFASSDGTVGALHRRILLLVGRPYGPRLDVVDQRKDLVRRGIDEGDALDAEGIGLGRGVEQDAGNRDNDHDANDGKRLQHRCNLHLTLGLSIRKRPRCCQLYERNSVALQTRLGHDFPP